MALILVIGYKKRRPDPKCAKVLYCGDVGSEARAVMDAPNAEWPVRYRYNAPYPTGGRKCDSVEEEASPVEDEMLPEDTPEAPPVEEEAKGKKK
jgi:hypothetical protein